MSVVALFFYLFAFRGGGVRLHGRCVAQSGHSVLFLILAFFNSAGLFVLMGAEFLAMILVVVYVGAVAVLFLFVVMMLDVNFAEPAEGRDQLRHDRRHYRCDPAAGADLPSRLSCMCCQRLALGLSRSQNSM